MWTFLNFFLWIWYCDDIDEYIFLIDGLEVDVDGWYFTPLDMEKKRFTTVVP